MTKEGLEATILAAVRVKVVRMEQKGPITFLVDLHNTTDRDKVLDLAGRSFTGRNGNLHVTVWKPEMNAKEIMNFLESRIMARDRVDAMASGSQVRAVRQAARVFDESDDDLEDGPRPGSNKSSRPSTPNDKKNKKQLSKRRPQLAVHNPHP